MICLGLIRLKRMRLFLFTQFSVCRNEINQLLNVLGRPCDPIPPVFVHGPAATGKTSIVREAMRVLRRPHAYASCRSSHTPRLMFESILNQLLGHVRSASNHYASARKCERLIDFTKHLPGACAQALACKEKRLRSIRKVRWFTDGVGIRHRREKRVFFQMVGCVCDLIVCSCRTGHSEGG